MLFIFAGEDDDPSVWGRKSGLPFVAGKILNRYNYRFYAPQKREIRENIDKKRKGQMESEEESGVVKKRKGRLPEKYCINKKKWFSVATEAEVASHLEIVPGTVNDDVHRILQYKMK
jgi:hypothetical protein